jgi:OmpA-OmpF porin, OOP family
MKLMNFAGISGTLAAAAFAVFAGSLAAADPSGWYVGGNLGLSQAEIDDGRIIDALEAAGASSVSVKDEDDDIGFKLFGGYQFDKHWSVEGGYFNLGEFGFKATTVPAGTLTGRSDIQGLNIDPVFTWPLSKKFSLLGRVGLTYAEADTSYAATGSVTAPPDKDTRATSYKFGVGAQYDFTRRLGMRAEAESYRIDDAVGNDGDVNLYSLGLVYRFFGSERAQARRAPPALVIVPVAAKTVKYCTILNIEFEINLDEIQREEKEKLAVVATFLKKYPDTTAVIEGHTDNIGTTEQNMSLSKRRAESVVAYLVDTHQIAASRLSAVGYGDTRPLASNDTEEGKRMNRRIGAVIACARDVEGLTVKPARITMALDMEFDLNKADIRPEHRDELGKVAAFLKANPSVTATVEGHTANLQMSEEDRMELSERRAENVVDYLVKEFGVSRSRLSAEGFGSSRRFAYNTSAEGQQENRRVNVIINYAK